MNWKKRIKNIVITAIAVLALTGCSSESGSSSSSNESGDGKVTTIQYWHTMTGVNGEAMD